MMKLCEVDQRFSWARSLFIVAAVSRMVVATLLWSCPRRSVSSRTSSDSEDAILVPSLAGAFCLRARSRAHSRDTPKETHRHSIVPAP
jgi:hypothetical protein